MEAPPRRNIPSWMRCDGHGALSAKPHVHGAPVPVPTATRFVAPACYLRLDYVVPIASLPGVLGSRSDRSCFHRFLSVFPLATLHSVSYISSPYPVIFSQFLKLFLSSSSPTTSRTFDRWISNFDCCWLNADIRARRATQRRPLKAMARWLRKKSRYGPAMIYQKHL